MNFKKIGLATAGVLLAGASQAAPIDVAAVVTDITAQGGSVGVLAGAVLVLVVAG